MTLYIGLRSNARGKIKRMILIESEINMDINELLDEVKLKLDVTSDYALAKHLEINQARITEYRKGKEIPDVYACFKFAEVLGKSPSVILAQVQSVFNKNEAKRLYFKRFFSILGLWITLGLILPNYTDSLGNAQANGTIEKTLNNQHKCTLCEVAKGFIRRLKNWLKHAIFGHICPILYV